MTMKEIILTNSTLSQTALTTPKVSDKTPKIGLIATNPKNYFQSRITKIMILIKY